MSFDASVFAQQGIPLPALYPVPDQTGFDFAHNNRLPDPMDLVRMGALINVSHSAGKDSQAMLIHLIERLNLPREQIVVTHACLGDSEWEGTEEHARQCAEHYGVKFLVCRAKDKSGNEKDLLDYVDRRGKFMGTNLRFCTSDWKRAPIRRTINAYREEIGHISPYVLNCMGMRSEESNERSKLDVFSFVQGASCPSKPYPDILDEPTRARRRIFFDWHPIHHFTQDQVFATIQAAGQKPHWAYTRAKARRLSCLICIYSSEDDIIAAVKHSDKGRAYAKRIIDLEAKHDHTILPLKSGGKGRPAQKRFIKDVVGHLLDAA